MQRWNSVSTMMSMMMISLMICLCISVLEIDRKETGELGSLGCEIKKKRFESYNAIWLQQMMLADSAADAQSSEAKSSYRMQAEVTLLMLVL